MAKQFFTNDLVWAKMKGYPYWPGKIVDPPPCSKPKKNSHYIYFFGTENCAWINDNSIVQHKEEMLTKYKKVKITLFQKAVEKIVEYSNIKPGIPSEKIDCSEAEVDESEKEDENSDEPKDDPVIFTDETVKECAASFEKFLDLNCEDKTMDVSSNLHSYEQDIEPDLSIEPSVSQEFLSKETELASSSLEQEDLNADSASTSAEQEDLNADSASTSAELLSNAIIPHPNLINNPILPEVEKFVDRPKSPEIDFSKSANITNKKINPTKKIIGFLGYSGVAKEMIKHLVHSGHSLIVCDAYDNNLRDFTRKLNCKTASSPADVVKASDITFALFSDADTAKRNFYSVLEEIEHSKVKKGYIEMTTMHPELAEKMSTDTSVKGGLYLVAQCYGSLKQASEGNLFITAGGDRVLYEDSKSCLDTISSKCFFASHDVQDAIKANTVCCMLVGALNVAVAETMSVAQARGLGGEFIKVLGNGGLNSDFHVSQAQAMESKNFQTQTSINEMRQYFTVGLALGNSVSLSTPVLSGAGEVYKRASLLNYGDHDISAVIQATKPHE